MSHAFVSLMLLSAVGAQGADSFEFSVFRAHLPRKEAGRLMISDAGVSYRSDHEKTKIDIPLLSVYQADVSDPKVIRVETYDILKQKLLGRQVHVFRLRGSVHDERLARFLSEALPRPVIGAFGPASQPEAVIRAYHRHRLGGCHGTIRIDSDAIRFVSDRPENSRTWLYRDLATIGTMNPFSFPSQHPGRDVQFRFEGTAPGECLRSRGTARIFAPIEFRSPIGIGKATVGIPISPRP